MENELNQGPPEIEPVIPETPPPAEGEKKVDEEAVQSGIVLEKEEKVDEPPEIKPDSDVSKKVEKLEARVGYLTRQLEKKTRMAQPLPEPEPDLKAPDEDMFDSRADYEDAVVDYKVQKALQDHHAKVRAQDEQFGVKDFVSDLITEGRGKYADFATVAEVQTVPITQPMLQIMKDCENPADIAYYLGKNLKECTAISLMSPVNAARALGKIEEKVKATLSNRPPPTATRKTSDAPPPIRPVGSAHPVTKDPEKMTQAEYEAERRAGRI